MAERATRLAGPPLANATTPGSSLVFFMAGYQEARRNWPEPEPKRRLEEIWGLLGVGICPVPLRPRQRPREQSETSLWGCLAACSNRPLCRSASFSQRRQKCILWREACNFEELSWHTSYATFINRTYEETAVRKKRWNLGTGPSQPLRVYASATSSFGPMLASFVSSVNRAGDRATVLVYHDPSEGYAGHEGRWPVTAEHHGQMRLRDRMKVNMEIRTVWDSLWAGEESAVLSDLDVQVFPYWSGLVRSCTQAAYVCVMQQPGLYFERTFPFNSGFLAFRIDAVTLEYVLDLAAEFEPQFTIEDLPTMQKNYVLEQNLLSRHLWKKGQWFWAVFNPEFVSIFVHMKPVHMLRLKVHHACGSEATHRLVALYNARVLYYSIFPVCLGQDVAGPQNPCCTLYGFERDLFHSTEKLAAPFLQGRTYGPVEWGDRQSEWLEQFVAEALPGATSDQVDHWGELCETQKMHGIDDGLFRNSVEKFQRGQIEGLPEDFARDWR